MQASTTITAIPPLLEKAFAQNIISSLELKLFGLFQIQKKMKYFDYIEQQKLFLLMKLLN